VAVYAIRVAADGKSVEVGIRHDEAQPAPAEPEPNISPK
jgi:hypothetical protein